MNRAASTTLSSYGSSGTPLAQRGANLDIKECVRKYEEDGYGTRVIPPPADIPSRGEVDALRDPEEPEYPSDPDLQGNFHLAKVRLYASEKLELQWKRFIRELIENHHAKVWPSDYHWVDGTGVFASPIQLGILTPAPAPQLKLHERLIRGGADFSQLRDDLLTSARVKAEAEEAGRLAANVAAVKDWGQSARKRRFADPDASNARVRKRTNVAAYTAPVEKHGDKAEARKTSRKPRRSLQDNGKTVAPAGELVDDPISPLSLPRPVSEQPPALESVTLHQPPQDGPFPPVPSAVEAAAAAASVIVLVDSEPAATVPPEAHDSLHLDDKHRAPPPPAAAAAVAVPAVAKVAPPEGGGGCLSMQEMRLRNRIVVLSCQLRLANNAVALATNAMTRQALQQTADAVYKDLGQTVDEFQACITMAYLRTSPLAAV